MCRIFGAGLCGNTTRATAHQPLGRHRNSRALPRKQCEDSSAFHFLGEFFSIFFLLFTKSFVQVWQLGLIFNWHQGDSTLKERAEFCEDGVLTRDAFSPNATATVKYVPIRKSLSTQPLIAYCPHSHTFAISDGFTIALYHLGTSEEGLLSRMRIALSPIVPPSAFAVYNNFVAYASETNFYLISFSAIADASSDEPSPHSDPRDQTVADHANDGDVFDDASCVTVTAGAPAPPTSTSSSLISGKCDGKLVLPAVAHRRRGDYFHYGRYWYSSLIAGSSH